MFPCKELHHELEKELYTKQAEGCSCILIRSSGFLWSWLWFRSCVLVRSYMWSWLWGGSCISISIIIMRLRFYFIMSRKWSCVLGRWWNGICVRSIWSCRIWVVRATWSCMLPISWIRVLLLGRSSCTFLQYSINPFYNFWDFLSVIGSISKIYNVARKSRNDFAMYTRNQETTWKSSLISNSLAYQKNACKSPEPAI